MYYFNYQSKINENKCLIVVFKSNSFGKFM